MGFVNLLGAILSLWTVNTFGRRSLLLFGHSTIAIVQVLIGYYLFIEDVVTVVYLCCIFAFVFEITNALVLWIYVTETCPDVAVGSGGMIIFGVVLFEAYTAFTFINWLHPSGFFLMYGVFSTLSFLFTYNFIAETKGLSDKEKKELYIPGAEWGRKLKPGEVYEPSTIELTEKQDQT